MTAQLLEETVTLFLKQDLRTLTKETGFLPNLPAATTYRGKKPGF